MKSIIEKARETQAGYDDVQSPAVGRGFVLGANYVLEQIENILSHPLKYVHSDKSVEEGMITYIANIIKQLKK